MKTTTWIVASLLSLAPLVVPPQEAPKVTADELRQWCEYLAGDAMRGRLEIVQRRP